MTSLLRAILDEYRLVHRLGARSFYQLGRTVSLYESFLKRPATVDDFSSSPVNQWLEHLERVQSQRTVAGHRINLLSLWKDAADRGLCPGPARVRKVPKPHPNPTSWTHEELQRVIRVCSCFHGTLSNGADRRCYFMGLANAAYDSGLRRSDLWSLPKSKIRPDGKLALIQQKTGRPQYRQLLPHTMQLVMSLPGECPLNWPGDPRHFYRIWQAVVMIAGVRPGCLQQIRRTGASYVKRATGSKEAVRRYLGHSSEATQIFYVDETIATPETPAMPPPLDPGWWNDPSTQIRD